MRDYWPTDAWRVSPPAKVGIEPAHVDALRQHVRSELPHVRSLMVVRRGYVVLEDYLRGLGPNDDHEVASITKSITSLIVGIAIARGELPRERTITELFAPAAGCHTSRAFDNVTVEHLLAMTGGFLWHEDNYREWLAAENQVEFALSLARADPPGTRFTYNTPALHLLSAALTSVTRRTLAHYAREHLFAPLGISHVLWSSDRQGNSYGGHSLLLRTRDLAKLGLLCASRGRWENRPLVPESWIQLTTKRHSDGGAPENERYGLGWWITQVTGRSAYFAGGFGGQYLIVVPSEDLVVAITSTLDRPHLENRALLADYLMPALDRQTTNGRPNSIGISR